MEEVNIEKFVSYARTSTQKQKYDKTIEIQDIPESELSNIPNDIEYKAIFKSEGMFNRIKTDYIFLISEEKTPEGTLRCFGSIAERKNSRSRIRTS